jgi:hypothetical protein
MRGDGIWVVTIGMSHKAVAFALKTKGCFDLFFGPSTVGPHQDEARVRFLNRLRQQQRQTM